MPEFKVLIPVATQTGKKFMVRRAVEENRAGKCSALGCGRVEGLQFSAGPTENMSFEQDLRETGASCSEKI